MTNTNFLRPQRALLSVSDKQGIEDLARALSSAGVELISTGGTARTLRDAGLEVVDVANVTGFPEMLDGRVKTLHPMVHGGILARRDVQAHSRALQEHGIFGIDIVCVNLYPFESTIAGGAQEHEAVEQIDIGGPAMVRSAAKNFEHVAVLTEPSQYERVIREIQAGGTTRETRRTLSGEAFARTAAYDGAIAAYFARTTTQTTNNPSPLPERVSLSTSKLADLRYGENPHQRAGVYSDVARDPSLPSLAHAQPLGGKALSFNNLNDANHAGWLAHDLANATGLSSAAVIKHTNPCGASVSEDPSEAIKLALEGDPQAAYGGILALSFPVDDDHARQLTEHASFLEVVLAPSLSESAAASLQARWKNIRLLPFDSAGASWASLSIREIPGGAIVQDADALQMDTSSWTIHNNNDANSAAGVTDLDRLTWICAKHVTSNAIVVARSVGGGAQLVGVGAGQVDRVTACRLAVDKAGERASGAVAASDAFFPFTDGPDVLAAAGVQRVLQPGGSMRDEEVLSFCAERGLTTVLTGKRHFRH